MSDNSAKNKLAARARRRRRIRKKITGTAERPRMTVFRSNKHIYAQIVDDTSGKTLASASTLSPEIRGELAEANKVDAARKVGQLCAQRALAAKVEIVVFDRNGFDYTGRVAAVADAAREAGLKF